LRTPHGLVHLLCYTKFSVPTRTTVLCCTAVVSTCTTFSSKGCGRLSAAFSRGVTRVYWLRPFGLGVYMCVGIRHCNSNAFWTVSEDGPGLHTNKSRRPCVFRICADVHTHQPSARSRCGKATRSHVGRWCMWRTSDAPLHLPNLLRVPGYCSIIRASHAAWACKCTL
jgi:hypothetical protein